jgi:hypothetical protein
MSARIDLPQPSTATTFAAADEAVRETGHLLATTHLPFDRRYELAETHRANVSLRETLRGQS